MLSNQIFRREVILDEICQEVQKLGFEFVSISLVSHEHNTIEAVYGIGIAKEWEGRAKHHIEKKPALRDIQADIVQTRQTEIIAGWDERFDRWIYNEFHHDRLVRIYTPLVIFRDEDGNLIENWVEQCQWEEISPNENQQQGQHQIFQMQLSNLNEAEIIVIGTVEAGYTNLDRRIERQQVVKLTRLLAQKALDIWKTKLLSLLEVVAQEARQVMKSDSATLHFLYDSQENRYTYEAFFGEVSRRFFKSCPPRRDGVGRQAIESGQSKFVLSASQNKSPLDLQNLNPEAFRLGFRALAAFPLQVDHQGIFYQKGNLLYEGVLYVGFQQEHQFNEEERRLGDEFAERAADVIRQAMVNKQMREQNRQLTTLHSITKALADISDKASLLHRIAWDSLNILAADVVTLYEYTQTEGIFETPPTVAGRLNAEQKMSRTLDEDDVPFRLIQEMDNVYCSSVADHFVFQRADFAQRESIQSAAGVQLKVGEETVGVMFVNYRRLHDFNQEIQIIETLASSAAIAIKNQRWRKARSQIERKIITTLEQQELLDLIVRQAVQLTRAELGTIRLLNPHSREPMLVTKAHHPQAIAPGRKRSSVNEGITGWVAREKKSALVDDVNSVQWRGYYTAGFPNIHSELCVPLLDNKGYLLGVLNMESERLQAFDQKHQQMLEALADQAVIGIQNVDNKEQLVRMEAMITRGNVICSLVHKMNNELGAIRHWINEIIDEGNLSIQEKGQKILTTTEGFLKSAELMESWIQEEPQPLKLYESVLKALEGVNIPDNIIQAIDIHQLRNLPLVLGGIQQLINVFDNLIQNAVDAMPEGGQLSINGQMVEKDRGSSVEIQVLDTGVGIPEENLDKIFRFGFTTKSDTGGRGWGLWITRCYVEHLGGFLLVNPELNQGAEFMVQLPVYQSETEREISEQM